MSLQAIFGQAINQGLTAYVKPGVDPRDDSQLRNLLSIAGFEPHDSSPAALNQAVTKFQQQAFPGDSHEQDGKAGPKTLQALQMKVGAHLLAATAAEQEKARDPSVRAFLGFQPSTNNLNAPAPAGSVKPNSADPATLRAQLDPAVPAPKDPTQADQVARLAPLAAPPNDVPRELPDVARRLQVFVGQPPGQTMDEVIRAYSATAPGVIQSVPR